MDAVLANQACKCSILREWVRISAGLTTSKELQRRVPYTFRGVASGLR